MALHTISLFSGAGMSAYYNEIDPHAAAWLRRLISTGHIAHGVVDERSILEIDPDELRQYTQCHFFAGVGGWSYALRLARWPDDRPVWTGSCPCQPFSTAGKQRGSDDERHLWPAFFDLIRECRPGSVFGEQVAGAAGLAWLDHVCADLEGAGYAAAAADLCAAGAGAPHIRQRLYWVAHAKSERLERRPFADRKQPAQSGELLSARSGNDAGDLADPTPGGQRIDGRAQGQAGHAAQRDSACWMADATEQRPPGHAGTQPGVLEGTDAAVTDRGIDAWSDAEWINCSDGKARPTQPGLFPLAHGVSKGLVRGGDLRLAPDADQSAEGRVMRLRGYGNAIVPQVAGIFVLAAMEPSA